MCAAEDNGRKGLVTVTVAAECGWHGMAWSFVVVVVVRKRRRRVICIFSCSD